MTDSTEPVDIESEIDKARRIAESRLLTQDEFKQIEARQLAKQLSVDKHVGHASKRCRSDVDETRHQEFVHGYFLI